MGVDMLGQISALFVFFFVCIQICLRLHKLMETLFSFWFLVIRVTDVGFFREITSTSFQITTSVILKKISTIFAGPKCFIILFWEGVCLNWRKTQPPSESYIVSPYIQICVSGLLYFSTTYINNVHQMHKSNLTWRQIHHSEVHSYIYLQMIR